MTGRNRERLPNRRAALTTRIQHGPHTFHVSYGLFPDGRLAEVFLAGAKVGSDTRIVALEASVAISFALQHGAGVGEMRLAMPRREDGSPEGVMGAILDGWERIAGDVIVVAREEARC